MAAILSLVMALMKAGEHIVASRSIFGATQQLFGNILPRFGIETSFVDQGPIEAFRAAMRPTTKLVFIETPSNPLTEVFDIAALAALRMPRRCWWSTTASARRPCSARWSWVPTW
jgi:O-succinylhomoserine sulfhydrylase